MRGSFAPVAVAVVALAALSLMLPYTLGYDAWAWLVWGREVGELALDTTDGPSWKPLPVIATTAFAPLGEAGPELWLLVARAGWLAGVALAFLLASRLCPKGTPTRWRVAAGAVAALGVALLSDEITPWPRQFAIGLSEPLLVALVLGALHRHLAGKRAQALGLGGAAALLRPESWPFVAGYALCACAREPRLRPVTAAGALAVAVLWFVPDLAGAGDPLEGATRARGTGGGAAEELLESLGWAFALPLPALWACAAAGVLLAHRHGERTPLVLGAVAAAWIAIVALLAAAGYAGLPRFSAAPAALVCVLGGSGLARLGMAAAARRSAVAAVASAALGLWLVAGGALRAEEVPGELGGARDLARSEEQLFAVASSAATATEACERIATTDTLFEPALAWELDVAIARIGIATRPAGLRGLVFVDQTAPARLRAAASARPDAALASSGAWSAYAFGCPRGAPSPASSGVTGASM